MKNKFLSSCLLVSFLCFQPVTADEETALGQQMELMNDAYKALRREKDTEKGASLARECQDAMIKAIVEVPELVKDMPDGPEKLKATATYRKMMGELIAIFSKTELAFLEGDLEKVAETVDAMRKSKKDAHEIFIEE